MKTLTCACLPDKKARSIIRKISKNVSKQCQSQKALQFQPHFTIRGDFKINDAVIAEFKTELQNFCININPLKLNLTKYGFYPWKIIFLDIDKDTNLQCLHNGCMEIIEKYRISWIPEKYKGANSFTDKQQQYALKYGYHFCYEFFSPHFTVASNDMSENCF